VPQLLPRHALSRIALAALAVLAATCSSPNKPGPVVVELVIQSVSPGTGPATGGTELTIRGAGFAAGTAVTIGGRAAMDVTVRGTDTITVKTPASTIAGAVDVVVLLNGKTGTLAGGFRYEVTTNNAPIIRSIVAQGTRLRQPANFADYGETIRLTAIVEDAQAAPALLRYEWQPCEGAVVGTGPQVEWKAPTGGSLPSICTINLTVSDGPRVVIGSLPVRLHDSVAEVGALARLFLDEFADSTIPADTTVRNFSDSCKGKADELKNVTDNRRLLIINSHIYGTAKVSVGFGGACASGSRRKNGDDACILTPVEWRSTYKETGAVEVAKGVSVITGVYRDSKWWLCDSLYDGSSTLGLHHLY
jgi:IPT/TIG domain